MYPQKHFLQDVIDLGLLGDTLRNERTEAIMNLLPNLSHRGRHRLLPLLICILGFFNKRSFSQAVTEGCTAARIGERPHNLYLLMDREDFPGIAVRIREQ